MQYVILQHRPLSLIMLFYLKIIANYDLQTSNFELVT